MTEQRAQTVNYVQKCRDHHHHLITVTNAELLISHVGHRLHEGFQTGGRSTSECHSQTPACSPSNSSMVGPYLVFKGQIVFLPLLGIKKNDNAEEGIAESWRKSVASLNSSWIFFLGGGGKESQKRDRKASHRALSSPSKGHRLFLTETLSLLKHVFRVFFARSQQLGLDDVNVGRMGEQRSRNQKWQLSSVRKRKKE